MRQRQNIPDDTPFRRQQAAEWLMVLRETDVRAAQIAAWLAWTRADPRNLDAFEQVSALAHGLGALDPEVKSGLARQLLAKRAPVPGPARWSQRRIYYAMAAGLAAATIILGYYMLPHRWARPALDATYATARAESRNLVLPDGTRVALSAKSRLEINYTAARRVVELRDGEAYFQVKHNAKRPFIVHAGELRLSDIGTAFDVRKTGDYVAVAVADGVVAVAHANEKRSDTPAAAGAKAEPLRLGAGQGVSTSGADGDLTVANVNTHKVASWRDGRLRFRNTPLSVVIANVNRYAFREIVITDRRVGRMRYTGTVFVRKIDDWLAATRRVFGLQEARIDRGERIFLYQTGAIKDRPTG